MGAYDNVKCVDCGAAVTFNKRRGRPAKRCWTCRMKKLRARAAARNPLRTGPYTYRPTYHLDPENADWIEREAAAQGMTGTRYLNILISEAAGIGTVGREPGEQVGTGGTGATGPVPPIDQPTV